MRLHHPFLCVTASVVLAASIVNGQTNESTFQDVRVKIVEDASGNVTMTFTDKDGKNLGTARITGDSLGNITTVLKDADGKILKREVSRPHHLVELEEDSDTTTELWPQRRNADRKEDKRFDLFNTEVSPSSKSGQKTPLWMTDDDEAGTLPTLPSFPRLPSLTDEPNKDEPKGRYLGQLGGHKFDPDSTSNPFGAGNPFNPNSVKNEFGKYGSEFSPSSPRNPFATQTPKLYDSQGNYRGKLSSNPFDPESVSNPFGRYGNKFSPDSINNPFGAGNPFSPSSPKNRFGQGLSIYGDE